MALPHRSLDPNPEAIERIVPLVREYDASVWHIQAYVPDAMDGATPGVHICPPAIDPLSPKNMAPSPEDAAFVCDQFGIDVDRPLMCQVSRFDPWKDPIGVIDAYRLVTQEMPEVQLALMGSMATDDPEGWEFFNSTMAHADGDPDIHILNNFNNVGAIEVNAFQSQADVVIQKSTREGFGLTVSEALWKGRPFIGGNVGGIPLQVQDGQTGFLVSSPDECADRSLRILREPEDGKQLMGGQGRSRCAPTSSRRELTRLARPSDLPVTEAPRSSSPRTGPGALREEDGQPSGAEGAGDSPPGPVHHRGVVGRLGHGAGGRRGSEQHGGARSMSSWTEPTTAAPGEQRPRGLRPLLQRGGQPDAVVHPALPVGPPSNAPTYGGDRSRVRRDRTVNEVSLACWRSRGWTRQ